MLLTVLLPAVNPHMRSAVIDAVHVRPGDLLAPGSRILDIKVDLSLAIPHDCPPVTFHRIASREHAWLRQLSVGLNDEAEPGAILAILSTMPDESLDSAPARAARCSVAGILHESDWWSGGKR